ncbi:MAG: hypothetical protein N2491_11890, partial [Negativicutes bacterium]|nr:hypothetical protein [Negativicutes bacterium]
MRPVIVYPPTIDWDYLHQRPQQLLKVLAELGCICIFCNPNIHKRHAPGFRHLSENLVLGSSVPFSGAVDWAKTTYPHQPVIAYFTYPPHISMLKAVKTDLLIFDAVDEPVEEFADWLPSYREAAQEADIILATARSLKERIYSLTGKEIHLLPNGCDYEHFKTAQIRQLVDIAPLNGSKPVIGYIGAIAPWLDFSLINVMARFLPDYEFAFIGPMLKQNWLAFTSPNMHYLGYVDYPSLP